MRKDETVGNKKKMQVCLPKHNYKLDNNLLTVEPGGVGQPKMCIPPGKILGTPLILIANSGTRWGLIFGWLSQDEGGPIFLKSLFITL